MPDATRENIDAIGAIPIALPEGASGASATVPLRQLDNFEETDGLNQISRENGKRRVVIQTNVRGRDVGTFVAESQAKVRHQRSEERSVGNAGGSTCRTRWQRYHTKKK